MATLLSIYPCTNVVWLTSFCPKAPEALPSAKTAMRSAMRSSLSSESPWAKHEYDVVIPNSYSLACRVHYSTEKNSLSLMRLWLQFDPKSCQLYQQIYFNDLTQMLASLPLFPCFVCPNVWSAGNCASRAIYTCISNMTNNVHMSLSSGAVSPVSNLDTTPYT